MYSKRSKRRTLFGSALATQERRKPLCRSMRPGPPPGLRQRIAPLTPEISLATTNCRLGCHDRAARARRGARLPVVSQLREARAHSAPRGRRDDRRAVDRESIDAAQWSSHLCGIIEARPIHRRALHTPSLVERAEEVIPSRDGSKRSSRRTAKGPERTGRKPTPTIGHPLGVERARPRVADRERRARARGLRVYRGHSRSRTLDRSRRSHPRARRRWKHRAPPSARFEQPRQRGCNEVCAR